MSNPIRLTRSALLTRIIPASIFLLLTLFPKIINYQENNNISLDVISKIELSWIVLAIVLLLFLGEIINYIRMIYYYVPRKFRKLVYEYTEDPTALTRRTRAWLYLLHKMDILIKYCKYILSLFIGNDIMEESAKIVKKVLMRITNKKFDIDGEHDRDRWQIKDSSEGDTTGERIRLKQLLFKYPNKSYDDSSGVSDIERLIKNSGLNEQDFSDSKQLYAILLNKTSNSQEKTSDLKNIFVLYKNIYCSLILAIVVTILYRIYYLGNEAVGALLLFFLITLSYYFLILLNLLEDIDSKYTKQMLLQYRVESIND